MLRDVCVCKVAKQARLNLKDVAAIGIGSPGRLPLSFSLYFLSLILSQDSSCQYSGISDLKAGIVMSAANFPGVFFCLFNLLITFCSLISH